MKLDQYLENNQIKDLTREELLELKRVLEKFQQKDLEKFGNRKKECYYGKLTKN